MATRINTFAISTLTKGAHCDFHNRVNNLIAATGAADLHIEALAAQYAQALAVEQSIVNRETAFVATAAMKEADKLRDALLSTINAVINAHQWNPIEDKKAAYAYLSVAIAPYKNAREHEYTRETSEVSGLLAALTADAAAGHITTLGLAAEVEALASANAAFAIEFDKKTAEAAARAPKSDISTKDARQACDTLYTQITELVNAYALIQPSDAITQFVTQLNGIVIAFDAIAAQKSTDESTDDGVQSTDESTDDR